MEEEEIFISAIIAQQMGFDLRAERPPPKKLELPPDPLTFSFHFLKNKAQLTEFYINIRREQRKYRHEEVHQSVITAERYFPDNSETQALKDSLLSLTEKLILSENVRIRDASKPIEVLEVTPFWLLVYLEHKYKLYTDIPRVGDFMLPYLKQLPRDYLPQFGKETPFKTLLGRIKTFIYFCLTSYHLNNHLELHRRQYFLAGHKIMLDCLFAQLPRCFEEQFTEYFLRQALHWKKLEKYRDCYSFATFLNFLDDPVESKELEIIYRSAFQEKI